MTLPIPSNVFADGELVDEAKLYARVFTPINTVYGLVAGYSYGEAEGTAANTVTLSGAAGATNYLVPNSAVTVTLATQRRVRAVCGCRVQSGSAVGTYQYYINYVAGASATLSGAITLGQANSNQVITTTTGGTGALTVRTEHTVLLAAGTWTFYPVAEKSLSGSVTDVAGLGYCAVYDAGST